MRRNNYNKSSTGTDIECLCFFDTSLSQSEFDDNIKVLQHSGYRSTSVGYYIDSGNVPDDSEIKFTVKGTREAREKHFLDNGRYYDSEEVKTWDDETLNDEILSLEEDVNLINYALEKLPSYDGIEFIPNKNLIALATCGYSQGDYAVVLYCPEDLEKAWGTYPKQENIQKLINHYYWDAPIYCAFTINGHEYQYSDMPEYNEYDWDREKFLAYVAKESGVAIETLEDFVPEYPDYQ